MEDKKFFDIIPPERVKEPSGEPEKKAESKPVRKPEKRPAPIKPSVPIPPVAVGEEETDSSDLIPRKISWPRAKVLTFSTALIFLISMGGLAYLKLPIVTIDVWLKTENLTFTIPAEVSKEVKSVNLERGLLPGKVVSEEQFLSQEFSSMGKAVREERAEGIIRIFNDYSTTSQSLVATTRFVSSEGKLFRLVERVMVPGQTLEKGKLVPGTVDALVRADAPGQDYNIGTSSFSIPGFAGTPKYTSFYAKSFSAMKGGFKGETAIVSAEDLEKAGQTTRAKITEKINNILKNRMLPGLLLVEQDVPLNILEQGPTAKVGEAVKNFNYQVRARKETILLSEDDLKVLAQASLVSRLSEDQRFLPESLKINPALVSLEAADEKGQVSLQISVKVYNNLESEALKKQLSGKSIQEVQRSFQDLSQVSQAKIKIFPSFFKNLPRDLDKIELKISFE
ncbi:MAG: hypothetical protein HY577_00185 [Candidatus Nealsonbacteria bacterium]|nr:hypothetical protein [Candidatus Nealsonbacteria bacterium]